MGRTKADVRQLQIRWNIERLEILEAIENPSVSEVGEIIYLLTKELERTEQRSIIVKETLKKKIIKYREVAPLIDKLESELLNQEEK